MAADLLATSVGFVPVGSKQRRRLSLLHLAARSSSNGDARVQGRLDAISITAKRAKETILYLLVRQLVIR